jgi:DUF2884 family protein
MKYATIFLMLLFMFTAVLQAADENDFKHKYLHCLEDADIDIEDATITIRDDDYKIEITGDFELYVNGKYIKTNDEQQELVEEYHGLIFEIIDRAKDIGKQGARIGIDGAKIGLKAIAGVFKLMRDDYDADDLEAELEMETEELEEMAEELEKEAEKLEYLADNLEDMHEELKDEIPELEELDSF